MRKKILTVDDEGSIRYLIRSTLRGRRYRVIEADNGAEGLRQAEKHHPDLIILDVVMPVKNGIETLMELRSREELAGTPVLLLTGVKEARKLDPLLSLGPTDFLAKPFLVDVLREKVKQMLERASRAAVPPSSQGEQAGNEPAP
jgi:CheY-like chemotaxis protein